MLLSSTKDRNPLKFIGYLRIVKYLIYESTGIITETTADWQKYKLARNKVNVNASG